MLCRSWEGSDDIALLVMQCYTSNIQFREFKSGDLYYSCNAMKGIAFRMFAIVFKPNAHKTTNSVEKS